MATDRQAYIDYLIFFTNKTEAYFEKMTDEQVLEEYERKALIRKAIDANKRG